MGDQAELGQGQRLVILQMEDVGKVQDLCGRGEFCWMDLKDPDDQAVHEVGEALGLDPFAIEDTQEFEQRPKVDTYANQLLLVAYGALRGEGGTLQLTEVHVHISKRFVLTVHRRTCSRLDELQKVLLDAPPDSEQVLIYRILDSLTDSLLDAVEAVAAEVSDQEAAVFRRPRARDRDRMAQLRRSLDNSRRVIQTQRQVFDRMVERIEDVPVLSRELRANYADISDHLWRAVDEMETARDSLHGMLDQHANAVQERLTIVATIFLPLTVVTGFFGQNFTWMINHIGAAWDFWGLGVGGLIGAAVAIWLWLIRTGMYDRPGKE
jgi:magnesium transporter